MKPLQTQRQSRTRRHVAGIVTLVFFLLPLWTAVAQIDVDTLLALGYGGVSDVVITPSGGLFVITRNGISHSSDSGNSWEALALPDGIESLSDVTMHWRDGGQGVLYKSRRQKEETHIFYWTDDSGQQWSEDHFIPRERVGFPDKHSMFSDLQLACDSILLVIYDARLYRSTDRGASFHHYDTPGYVRKLHFLDQYGWMEIQRDSMAYLNTTDAGESWTEYALPAGCSRFRLDRSGRAIAQGEATATAVFVTQPFSPDFQEMSLPQGYELLYIREAEYIFIDTLHQWYYAIPHGDGYPDHVHKESAVYSTTDAGKHWIRSVTVRNLNTPIWLQNDQVLFRSGSAAIFRLTRRDAHRFTLKAENTSENGRHRITLTWSDANWGRIAPAVIERAYGDSMWIQVGSTRPPDLFFDDETISPMHTARYRVTLSTPEGSKQRYSDSITAFPDANVNVLSFLLPSGRKPQLYRYTYRYENRGIGGGYLRTEGILAYTYRGAYDSTRWLRIHSFDVRFERIDGVNIDTTDVLHEYRGAWPSFVQPPGYADFSIFGFPEGPQIIFHEKDRKILIPPYQALLPSSIFSTPVPDSIRFQIGYSIWGTGTAASTITAVPNTGIVHKRTAMWDTDEMGWESELDVVWEAIKPPTAIGTESTHTARASIHCHPNPFHACTILEYTMEAAGPIRISLHDILGREIRVLLDTYREAGTYSLPIDASALARGTYFSRVYFRGHTAIAILRRL
jgi:photosystem II stability/assembly factor-like uncharacterized protein